MSFGIARLLTQSVLVETRTGSSGYGDLYAAPVTKKAFIDDQRKLIRDAQGNETVSETTLFTLIDDIDAFTTGSRVTVNGRIATVLSAKRRDAAGPVNVHHAEIHLN